MVTYLLLCPSIVKINPYIPGQQLTILPPKTAVENNRGYYYGQIDYWSGLEAHQHPYTHS